MKLMRECGGVYFVEGAGLIKIGVSEGVRCRFRDLQAMCPIPLRLLGYIPGAHAGIERALHRRFHHLRHHGEWFTDAPQLRDLINNEDTATLAAVSMDEAGRALGLPVRVVRELLEPASYSLGPRGGQRVLASDLALIAGSVERAAVEEGIKVGMKRLVETLHESREGVAAIAALAVTPAPDALHHSLTTAAPLVVTHG